MNSQRLGFVFAVNDRKRFRRRFILAGVGLAILILIGPALPAQPRTATPGVDDGIAQHLPLISLTLGTATIQVQVADTEPERELGLMYVTQLGDNEGMLFVMPHIEPATFWMKNTLISLSVAYLDAQGVVLDIHDMRPRDLTPVPSEHAQVAYALEMNLHWFALNGIKPGARLLAPSGHLPPPPSS